MSRKTLLCLGVAALAYWLLTRKRSMLSDIPIGMKIAGDLSVLSNESPAAIAAATPVSVTTSAAVAPVSGQMDKLESYKDRLVRYGMQFGLITRSANCRLMIQTNKSQLRNCNFDPGVNFDGAASFVSDRLGYPNPDTGQVTTPPIINRPIVQAAPGVYVGGAISTGAPTPVYGPNKNACANSSQGTMNIACRQMGGKYSHPKVCRTSYGTYKWNAQACRFTS